MRPVRSFLIIFFAISILFSQVGCSGTQPQPTPDFSRIATQSAVAPTPKATIQPSPSPTNTVNISQTSCLGKGLPRERVWSPDGKFFAIGSPSGVYLYDGATLQQLQFFKVPNAYLAFGPGNRLLTVVKRDDEMQMSDVSPGQLLRTFQMPDTLAQQIALSPDGDIIAFGGGKESKVILFGTNTGQQLHILPGNDGIKDITFSADGTLLVVHGYKYLRIWRVSTGLLSSMFPLSAAHVALSPDGHEVAATGKDVELISTSNGLPYRSVNGSTFTTMDAKTGIVLHTMDVKPEQALAVAFSPEGNPLGISISDNSTRLWNIRSGKVLQTFAIPADYWSSVVFSPNGSMTVFDNHVHPWIGDIATGQKITELTGFTDTVSGLVISPDGQNLVSARVNNGELMVMDLHTNTILYTANLKNNSILDAVFSPDGQRLLVTMNDWMHSDSYNTVSILDAQTGQVVSTLPQSVSSAIYSPDGQILVETTDQQIQLWDVTDNQLLYTLNDTQAIIYGVAFSADGHYLATSRKDEKVKIWDAETGQFIRELPTNSSTIAFHPNGHVLALMLEHDAINLIDTETGKFLWAAPVEYSDGMAFSPDGQKVFELAYNNTLKMLNTSDGQSLSSIGSSDAWTPGDFPISTFAVHPNSHTVVTGGYDGRICFWEIP
jgi:WD40 repeat protein